MRNTCRWEKKQTNHTNKRGTSNEKLTWFLAKRASPRLPSSPTQIDERKIKLLCWSRGEHFDAEADLEVNTLDAEGRGLDPSFLIISRTLQSGEVGRKCTDDVW